jgi:hypothetical protein
VNIPFNKEAAERGEPIAHRRDLSDRLFPARFVGMTTQGTVVVELPERFKSSGILIDEIRTEDVFMVDPLEQVREAVRDYYYALDKRVHGGSAADKAMNRIERALGMNWVQGAEKARREGEKK